MKRHERYKYSFCHLIGAFTPEQQRWMKEKLHEAGIDKISCLAGYRLLLKLGEATLPTMVLCAPTMADGTHAMTMLAALRNRFGNRTPPVFVIAFSDNEAELLLSKVLRQGFDGLLNLPGRNAVQDLSETFKHAVTGIGNISQYLFTPSALRNRPSLFN
jgi:hypothetical protein